MINGNMLYTLLRSNGAMSRTVVDSLFKREEYDGQGFSEMNLHFMSSGHPSV